MLFRQAIERKIKSISLRANSSKLGMGFFSVTFRRNVLPSGEDDAIQKRDRLPKILLILFHRNHKRNSSGTENCGHIVFIDINPLISGKLSALIHQYTRRNSNYRFIHLAFLISPTAHADSLPTVPASQLYSF